MTPNAGAISTLKYGASRESSGLVTEPTFLSASRPGSTAMLTPKPRSPANRVEP